MAVRKQCNRYRTDPMGEDYKTVLRKGKAFFTHVGIHTTFEIAPFEISAGKTWWHAHRLTVAPFKQHEGTIIVKWNLDKKRWEEIEA